MSGARNTIFPYHTACTLALPVNEVKPLCVDLSPFFETTVERVGEIFLCRDPTQREL